MSATAPALPHSSASGQRPWPLAGARSFLAVALVWGLHKLVLDNWLAPRSGSEPPVITATALGWLAGLALIGTWWLGAAICGLLRPDSDTLGPLRLSAIGVALWAFSSSTIDEWLINANAVVGPPRGESYVPLLWEYAVLLPAITGAAVISSKLRRTGLGPPRPQGLKGNLLDTLGLAGTRAELAATRMAWPIAIALGVIIVPLLTGPIITHTRALQVYFAVAVGMFLTVYVARKLAPDLNPAALWPVPWILGVIGVLVAIGWPALRVPLEYSHLNSLPAWGLVRPLPVQFVSVGIAAILWSVRPVEPAGSRSS